MKSLIRLFSFFLASFMLASCATHRATPPPEVSAKAWAIADGQTGKLLWGHDANVPMKSASTTKMMCAHVILKLAAQQPAVLDETVTFSALADNTPGSTAGVKVGEKLSVRECLYGLLLPSGNDAGNALAEHFNDRFAPPDERLKSLGLANTSLVARVQFIAEMNREAQRLGLANTIYRSSYGDGGTAEDRTTTVRDLTHLAWHAMKDERFREYVRTQRHECRVQTPEGGSREIVWKNTNQLLPLNAGYDGVKTGTTEQAGECLVSSGWRGGDHLFVAVLGSKTNSGRYADTRSLYEWAWSQRRKH
jgi:D-alanyl-D-alanine carboxypeptidase (penicillin-binding protein 5/6)